MSTDQVELATGAISSAIASADPYSAEWWESRTAAELRDIISNSAAPAKCRALQVHHPRNTKIAPASDQRQG